MRFLDNMIRGMKTSSVKTLYAFTLVSALMTIGAYYTDKYKNERVKYPDYNLTAVGVIVTGSILTLTTCQHYKEGKEKDNTNH
jgi:hypothetical protein